MAYEKDAIPRRPNTVSESCPMHVKHRLLRLSLPVQQTTCRFMEMPHRQTKRASENRPAARLNKKRGNLECEGHEILWTCAILSSAADSYSILIEIRKKTQKCSRSHRASKVCSQLLLDGFCSFRSCKGEQSVAAPSGNAVWRYVTIRSWNSNLPSLESSGVLQLTLKSIQQHLTDAPRFLSSYDPETLP